jgi:hypothetical protein
MLIVAGEFSGVLRGLFRPEVDGQDPPKSGTHGYLTPCRREYRLFYAAVSPPSACR